MMGFGRAAGSSEARPMIEEVSTSMVVSSTVFGRTARLTKVCNRSEHSAGTVEWETYPAWL